MTQHRGTPTEDEYALSEDQLETIADLKIQAMMFNMDIDWETLSLVPRSDYKEPEWLSVWKDKVSQSDQELV